jgi:hypothetical protein
MPDLIHHGHTGDRTFSFPNQHRPSASPSHMMVLVKEAVARLQ